VRNAGNLTAGAGVINCLGSAGLWDFADPYKGMNLVDADPAGSFPFYSDDDATTYKVTTDDTPKIWVGDGVVYPPPSKATQFDETMFFTDYAVWQFPSGVVYFLGNTAWSVRYQGNLTDTAGTVTFVNSGSSGTTGSSGFTRNNSNQRTAAPASQSSVRWRAP